MPHFVSLNGSITDVLCKPVILLTPTSSCLLTADHRWLFVSHAGFGMYKVLLPYDNPVMFAIIYYMIIRVIISSCTEAVIST